MKIDRIKPPKYQVGRYSINEYELRQLMAQVATGDRQAGIKVKDETGHVATILENGRLSSNLKGLDINSKFTLTCIRASIVADKAKAEQ